MHAKSPPPSPQRPKIMRFAAHAAWAVANRFGWLGKPVVGDAPHLNPEALESWRAAIGRASVYLEYGGGGSTFEAVHTVPHVVSVETDRRYLDAVERKIGAAGRRDNFHPVFVDIGWTRKWGRPLVAGRSVARLAKWRRYPSAPWDLMDSLGLSPDFIFVDGRFRTASVLESFLRLPAEADCLFMLDDFDKRTGLYGSTLEFATDIEFFDRTVTFRRKPDFDRERCRELLELYCADPE